MPIKKVYSKSCERNRSLMLCELKNSFFTQLFVPQASQIASITELSPRFGSQFIWHVMPAEWRLTWMLVIYRQGCPEWVYPE